MLRLRWILFCTVCFGLRAEEAGVEKLSWMSGCWSMNRGTATIEEHWSKPAAGNMLGYSRTVRGGRLAFHEFMRLEQADGAVRYIARIGPKDPGTPFTLTKLSDGEAEFSNPAHDFPQVIRYKRVSKDEMHARVEDLKKTRGQDYPMRRVACE